ncbi:MAG: hypothetical protein AAFY41_19060 [Bacteroidota bacterium]
MRTFRALIGLKLDKTSAGYIPDRRVMLETTMMTNMIQSFIGTLCMLSEPLINVLNRLSMKSPIKNATPDDIMIMISVSNMN